jgi:hypothetical protein
VNVIFDALFLKLAAIFIARRFYSPEIPLVGHSSIKEYWKWRV